LPDADALFVAEGTRFVPTELSRGPWSPDALHGGPVAALLAGQVEKVDSDGPMFVARMTVELERPVPLAPLSVITEISRPGKKVQIVDQRLISGGSTVARARAVRIRLAELDLPPVEVGTLPQPPPVAGAIEAPISEQLFDLTAYHSHSVEMRFASGGRMLTGAGPSVVWMRLKYPIVAGQEPTPLQRVCAVADFGNGVSSPLDFEHWMFINPDLSIALHRLPESEWVCLDCRTELEPSGLGFAQSQLFDEQAHLGTAVQTLIVDTR